MQQVESAPILEQLGIERLQQASTFGALSAEAIRFLMLKGKVFEVAAGECLFKTGEPADSFFVALSGGLDYYLRHDHSDQYVLIRKCEFGDQMGYVSMMGLEPRLGVARLSSPGLMLEINSELFYQLHLEHPSDFGILMLNLSRDMARVVRLIGKRLAELEPGEPLRF